MTDIKNKFEKKDWQNLLTKEQYRITRESGTERPFTGPYLNEKSEGVYSCICCDLELFNSEHKFDSGTGWPSFFNPHNSSCLNLKNDNSLNSHRVEVQCSNCDAHLGHVFEDGPAPSGLRYCINGNSLKLIKENQ
jgi:peptide-methionine (R)-S-oxide reductase